MRQAARARLAAAVTVAAAGAAVLGQGAGANAVMAGPRVVAGQASGTAYRQALAGSTYVPAKRVLYPGLHGADVQRLQRRLTFLHYYAGRANGTFGMDTLEAVWAFKEVQSGLAAPRNPNIVGPAMQRELVNPKLPRVLVPHGGSNLRIEVSKRTEVLVLYHHNKVELISHVSTGGGYYFCTPHGGTCGYAITPDGNYRAHWFAPGWLTVPLGAMYNPVFFIGGSFAIHGDIPVPLAPVSHGCVRIPMDIAGFFHTLIHISQTNGTPIYIRGPRV